MNKIASIPVATNNKNTLTLPDKKIYDLLFSPNDMQVIALDKKAFLELNELEKGLDEVAKKLAECRAEVGNDDNASMVSAQKEVRKKLVEVAGLNTSDDPDARDIQPLIQGGSFSEVVRLSSDGEKIAKYSLVPSKFFEDLKSRIKKQKRADLIFQLPSEVIATTNNHLHEEKAEDTLSGLRYTADDENDDSSKKAGDLDPEKVKNAFNKVKVSIKKEWEILDASTSGQIPSSYSRFVPGIHRFLTEEQFDLLDKWIAHINEDAKVSFHQYEQYRDEIVNELNKVDIGGSEKDPNAVFLPESWDKVKRLTKDIWGETSDIYLEYRDKNFQEVEEKADRDEIITDIQSLRLPTTKWDGSAGAQLMRYSAGASVKAEFDLLKEGRLALGAEAKFDAALAEAKAQGRFFYPDNNGYPLKPTVLIKQEKLAFKPTSNTFDINRSTPYFAVDSSLLTPSGAANVLSCLSDWQEIQNFSPRVATSQKAALYVQVVGHTSATGSLDYNQRLGLRRASIVADVFKSKYEQWLNHFKRDLWGQDELEFMVYANLLMSGRIRTKNEIDWNQMGIVNQKIPLVEQLKALAPEIVEYRNGNIPQPEDELFIRKEEWFKKRRTDNPNIRAAFKIEEIIEQYTSNLRRYAQKVTGSTISLQNIPLHSTPYVSLGETDLAVDIPDEVFENRRCEFIAYELDLDKTTIEKLPKEIDLGCFRCEFEGHVSAWVGANLQLGAQVAVAAPQGTLALMAMAKEYKSSGQVGDAKYKAKAALEAEAVASAFAGAKAEAGLKAALSWRAPAESVNINEFKPMGAIGYTATGLLGIGGNAEFKVGFDKESNRFVLKVHAEAALGPGIGGQLDIVVGVGQCFEFIQLVHGELVKHDFNFIDIFEQKGDESDIDVFELFSAWSWKLLKNGHLLSAGATAITGAVAAATVEILVDVRRLQREWEMEDRLKEDTENLIEVMNSKPDLIQFLSPETKGRILFDLIDTSDWKEQLSGSRFGDLNNDREEAAKTLILHGVNSRRDWQETLEHLANHQNGQMKPSIPHNSPPEEKLKRALDNENLLRQKLLNDEDDWDEVMAHIQSLPDPRHQ